MSQEITTTTTMKRQNHRRCGRKWMALLLMKTKKLTMEAEELEEAGLREAGRERFRGTAGERPGRSEGVS